MSGPPPASTMPPPLPPSTGTGAPPQPPLPATQPLPSTTQLLPSTTSAIVATSGAVTPYATPQAPQGPVMTPTELTAAVLEIGQAIAGIRSFLAGPYATQPPPQPYYYQPYQQAQPVLPAPQPTYQQALPAPSPPPLPAAATAAVSYQYGMPYDGLASSTHQAVHPPPSTGVPITQIAFPQSPSQLPSSITGLSEASVSPVYTTARSQPSVPPLLYTGLGVTHGGVPASCTGAPTALYSMGVPCSRRRRRPQCQQLLQGDPLMTDLRQRRPGSISWNSTRTTVPWIP